MTFIKHRFAPIIILFAIIAMQACKAKKLVQKPNPTAETVKPVVPVEQPKPKPAEETKPVVEVKKPSLNVENVKIQFEFDSSILKTDSYSILDQVASAIKLNPSIKYNLNGYASIEGTEEHNMTLSADRANAVKTYLLNNGVNADDLRAKGYGTNDPVADNSTESGRILNRRVEIRTQY